ncbi:MAG: serine hydrolase domain-containing protein [Myxococcota bacterium]
MSDQVAGLIRAWLVVGMAGGCSPKPEPPVAAARAQVDDLGHALASGARFTVAPGWRVETLPDGVRVMGPEGHLEVHLVETTGPDLEVAIGEAWRSRAPDFDRGPARSSALPLRNGWTEVRRVQYETSPHENRWVQATGVRTPDGRGVVLLLNVPADHAQRRQSELKLLIDSVMAPGFTPERYAGREVQPLDASRLDQVRTWIREAKAETDLPGVAVALFDRDILLMAEGFGVREVGKDDPITADTPFLIASNTKSLTTLLLAKLVEEERFEWDDPVTEVYPAFRLGDEATTAQVRMRHLVCACTGLPRQDNEWLFTYHEASPRQALDVLGTMQPTTGFGELYQYSNPLAAAAGFVGAHAVFPDLELGLAYDRAMQTRVFEPLGMTQTTFDFEVAAADGAASPHGWDASVTHVPITNTINRNVHPVRPAGGAWSTVRDYARYVQLELAQGALPDGGIYLDAPSIQERHRQQIRIDQRSGYGMGLVVTDVKGVQVVSHGGALVGFTSNFFFVPEAGVGGVVMTNADIGWTLTTRFSAFVMELLYADDTPEALADVKVKARNARASMIEDRKTWQLPVSEAHIGMLARHYRSKELGDIVVKQSEEGRLYFATGGWTTEVATKLNPDGSLSFVILEPGLLGYTFSAGQPDGMFEALALHEPQRTYVFEALER